MFLLLCVHPERGMKGMPVKTCQGRGDSGGTHETYQSASVTALQQLLGDDVEGFREDLDPAGARQKKRDQKPFV